MIRFKLESVELMSLSVIPSNELAMAGSTESDCVSKSNSIKLVVAS